MICLSLKNLDLKQILKVVKRAEICEIRLDMCKLSKKDITSLFVGNTPLIATCRTSQMTKDECFERLSWAIEANKKKFGGKYIDIEIDAPEDYRNKLVELAKKYNYRIIISYHNLTHTDPSNRLKIIVEECKSMNADIVKIVTTALDIEDAARVLSLYKEFTPEKLVAFTMGPIGKFSRFVSASLGAPFFYTALSEDMTTGDSQPTIKEAIDYLNKKKYPNKINKTRIITTTIAPASKSHAQRAIIAASLSKGISNLYGYTPCQDIDAAIALVKSIGVDVSHKKHRGHLIVKSPGAEEIKRKISESTKPLLLKTGESGILSKLTMAIAGHLCANREVVINGSGTLLRREYRGCKEALEQIDLNFDSNEGYLPVKISGLIKGGNVHMLGNGGSQLLSGILMTLPLCRENSKLQIDNPTSRPYIDLTLKTLRDFNVKITNQGFSHFTIPGRQRYRKKIFYAIQGDWSSAAILLVAAAISGSVRIKNLPVNTSQADEKILDVLRSCGASISVLEAPKYLIMCGDVPCAFKDNPNEDSCGNGEVEVMKPKSPLLPFEYDATDTPDLFPPLVVLALNCAGTSRIKGVHRLYNKESNRAESLYGEFTKLGAQIEIEGDYMFVKGSKLNGGYCSSYGDHRIAMALIVASLTIKEPLFIDNLECLSKSYPSFLSNFI